MPVGQFMDGRGELPRQGPDMTSDQSVKHRSDSSDRRVGEEYGGREAAEKLIEGSPRFRAR